MKRFLTPLLIATIAVAMTVTVGQANPKHSSKKSAWIGASIQTVDGDLADAFDLPVAYGVILNSLVQDAPAAEAGLERDDIIIEFNGNRVLDEDDLRKFINRANDGDEVSVIVMRDDQEMTFNLTLASKYDYDRNRDYNSDRKLNLNRKKAGNHSRSHNRESVARPFLGVSMMDLNDQLGDFFGVGRGRGALVTEVVEDSPAEEAGLKAGDVIVKIDNDAVDGTRDVMELIAEKDIDDKINLSIIRDKQEVTISATLGEREGREFGWMSPSKLDRFSNLDLSGLDALRQNLRSVPDFKFDEKEFQAELKELKREMRELQNELKQLRGSGR